MYNLECPMCGYPAIVQSTRINIPKYKYKCLTVLPLEQVLDYYVNTHGNLKE